MSEEERESLSPIRFTYAYAGNGWAHAWLSDGVTALSMTPSYVNGSYPTNDPLEGLVGALVTVLTYEGEAECTWEYEPAADRWVLQREDDKLHITIRGVPDGFSRPNWQTQHGEVRFSATCDLWKFAAKVRLAVSRLQPVDEQYHDPTGVQRSPDYRALCSLLQEHKRAQHPLPPTSTGRRTQE
jgi:hypothetical protein